MGCFSSSNGIIKLNYLGLVDKDKISESNMM